VDATIINAPSSTKNAEKKRDPEMHQTKKGNEWRFGMKCHIGVDAGSGLVHSIEVTSANVHDVTVAAKLIRDDDEVVYGDSGYIGIEKRPEIAGNEHLSKIEYRFNRRQHSFSKTSSKIFDWERYIENRKSSVRCKVEHAFRIIKCQFGYRKTAYKGLKKNANRLYALFACANLYMLAIAGRKLSTVSTS
jgi:IS5 family transposase